MVSVYAMEIVHVGHRHIAPAHDVIAMTQTR
jgi:hypothetical protein